MVTYHLRVVGLTAGTGLLPLLIQLHLAVVGRPRQRNRHAETVGQADLDIKQHNPQQHRQHLLDIAAHRHRERARDLVRLEGGDVEQEGDDGIAQQCKHLEPREVALGDVGHELGALPREVRVQQRLHRSQGAHAQEELQRGQLPRAGHQAVGDHGLDGGEHHPQEGEHEAEVGEVVVAIGNQTDAEDQGNEGEVSLRRVGACKVESIYENGENRDGGSKDLVERH